MSQQTKQLREFVEKVPFVVEINIRPSDMTAVADVSLPSTQWGEYTYTRANLERRLRINNQFCDPPGEARADYLIVAEIARRFAEKHGTLEPAQWQFDDHASVYEALQPDRRRARRSGLNLLSRDRLKQLGTNGIQIPITKQGGELVGTKRAYEDKFDTPDGKANFVAARPELDRRRPARLPARARSSPTTSTPTSSPRSATRRSGSPATPTAGPRTSPSRSRTTRSRSTQRTREKLGVSDGDWVQLENQYATCDGVANVSDVCPPGVMSAIFGWQGPTDENPNGEPQLLRQQPRRRRQPAAAVERCALQEHARQGEEARPRSRSPPRAPRR